MSVIKGDGSLVRSTFDFKDICVDILRTFKTLLDTFDP